MTTVSSSKYLSPAFLRIQSLIPQLPFLIIIGHFITLNFLNTEYNIKAVLISCFISISFFTISKLKKYDLQPPKNITLLSFIYLLFSTISFLFSKTPNVGLSEITQDFSMFLLFLVITSYLQKKPNNLLINLSQINISIQALVATTQFIFLQQTRAYGSFMSFFDHRLVYPNALAFSLLISLFAIQDSKSKYTPYLTTIGTITLLITLSRGAIIAGAISFIVFSIIKISQKQHKKLFHTSLSLIIAIITFLGISSLKHDQNLQEKFTFQGTEKITSVMERHQFFLLTPKLIQQAPLLGYGPNSFQYIFPTIQEIPLSNSQHPHNIFLKIAVERGLISLVTFIIICVFTIKYTIAHKLYLSKPGLILGITAAGLHSLIDYNLNLPLNSLLLIITLATLYQNQTPNSSNNTQKYLGTFTAITLLILSGTLFLKHFTYKYPQKSPISISSINYQNSLIIASQQTSDLNQKISLVTKHTQLNPYDSFAFSDLGHIYKETKQNSKAIQNFKKSIQLNPKNFWYPYAELTSIYKDITPTEIITILENLSEYQNAATQNLHFTAQSDNINQAIKTAKNLSQLTNNQDFIQKTEEIILSLQSSQERFTSN